MSLAIPTVCADGHDRKDKKNRYIGSFLISGVILAKIITGFVLTPMLRLKPNTVRVLKKRNKARAEHFSRLRCLNFLPAPTNKTVDDGSRNRLS